MSQSANAENGTGADFASCIREYRKKLQTLDGDINVTEIKSLTDDVIHFKQMRIWKNSRRAGAAEDPAESEPDRMGEIKQKRSIN